ncbi:MAG TPA: hypothetical protein VHB46_08385 [Burkholderiales bacterium]|nr:hypothetical protein [Burkholderiales bacterium]
MKIVGAVFGFLLLAGVFVLWVKMYRSIKGDDSPLFSGGSRKPASNKENSSIEAFIASYKRGEIKPAALTAAPPTLASVPAADNAAAEPTMPVKRNAFISGGTKLVYLMCKTGLRDHHVFAQVPVPALSTGGSIDPALARSAVDLLVCNAAMAPVAAIDVVDAAAGPANAGKSEHLRMLGIRYLRLSAKSLPRPDELHALLYKM